jgi:aminoglycoside phosphotransferase (APT) family kinase protein
MMDEFYSTAMGVPPLEGVPDEARTVARYEALSGQAVRELNYYKVLAGLRFALIITRSRDLSVEKGVLQPDSTLHTHNPVTQQLARWLDLPVPDLCPEYAHMLASYVEGKA